MYVGSTGRDFDYRWGIHLSQLKSGTHGNRYLVSDVEEYGIKNFEFEILQECKPEYCESFEQYWRNMLRTNEREFGYDIAYVAGSTLGVKYTPEGRQNVSKSKQGENQWSWGLYGELNPLSRGVLQFTKSGEFVREWGCIKTIQNELRIDSSGICLCCRGKSKSAGGFVWKYKTEKND